MCTHDSYKAGLFCDIRLIRTYGCVIHEAGLFGDLRLIHTCVRMIDIRQDCLVTLD